MALPINIEDLLNKRKVESNRIEFKKGWNPDKIYHTICAFATDIDNTGGGYILVGVEQDDNGLAKRPVTGLPLETIDDILKDMVGYDAKISSSNLRSISYNTKVSPEEIDGKTILAIWVPTGPNRPYCVAESVVAKNKSPLKPTIQKSLRENGSGKASIETDDDRTYFLMTIPCREDMVEVNRVSSEEVPHQELDELLLQILGQTSVKVQNAVYQCSVSNKSELLQILRQLSVKVWDKSKKTINKALLCQYAIEMIEYLKINPATIKEIMGFINHPDITEFRRKILNPLIDLGYVAMTNPDKPKSSKQKYKLTNYGASLFEQPTL